MDQLPVELVRLILKYLPLSELITCTKVCQLWSSLVYSFKIDSLIVCKQRKLPSRKWFYTNEVVDCGYSFQNSSLEQINLRDPFFANFKSIYLYSIETHFKLFDLGQSLNHFKTLERLEITYLELTTESQLTLPSLKIFSVQHVKGKSLVLNTPKLRCLRVLVSESFNKVEIVYPKQIFWLETFQFNKAIYKFTNLEHLFCKTITKLDTDFVDQFKRLVRISFNQIPHVFDQLKQQVKRTGRESTLSVYFVGFAFEKLPVFDFSFKPEHLYEKNTSLYEVYYPLACDLMPFINALNYTDLETRFKSKIPKGLAKKLVDLHGLLVTREIEDKGQFFRFVRECGNLPCLALIYSSASFYSDLLETVCPFIQTLKVQETNAHSIQLFERLFKKYRNLYSISCREGLNIRLEYEYRYENEQLEVMIIENIHVRKNDKDAILIV